MSSRTKGRSCEGKQRHHTRQQAMAHLWSFVNKFGAAPVQVGVYRCRHCGFWHLGHQPGRRRR